MPLSELARYRLGAVNRFADETATNALEAENAQRQMEQANARRMAVARVVGGFNPTGDRNQIYESASRTMMGLLPYGQEGQNAAEMVNKNVETYSKLNPQFRPQTPAAAKEPGWIDATETPDEAKYPLQKKFGTSIHKLMRGIDPATRKPIELYKYTSAGTVEKPDKGDEAGARQEKMDLQKQKDAYNQAHAAKLSYEKRFGADTLQEWTKLLEKEQPSLLGIAMDPNIPEDQKSQQLVAALGTVADPTLRAKLTNAANYATASAKRDAYHKNIEDRGHYVDEAGNLQKGKRPTPKATPKTVSLKAARQKYGDTAKEYSDEELKAFLAQNGFQVTE